MSKKIFLVLLSITLIASLFATFNSVAIGQKEEQKFYMKDGSVITGDLYSYLDEKL